MHGLRRVYAIMCGMWTQWYCPLSPLEASLLVRLGLQNRSCEPVYIVQDECTHLVGEYPTTISSSFVSKTR